MYCIVDARVPGKILDRLGKYFDLITFSTDNITHEYISGHPDIFFCASESGLVCAGNLPEHYFCLLNEKNIKYITGDTNVGFELKTCSAYNCLALDNLLVHKLSFTDYQIISRYDIKSRIDVKQSMTRCSTLVLSENDFITSDIDIARTLKAYNKNVVYVNPASINLPGVSHGLFGGTTGIAANTVFFLGSIKQLPEFHDIRFFIRKVKMDFIELSEGPLFDGGSLIFID